MHGGSRTWGRWPRTSGRRRSGTAGLAFLVVVCLLAAAGAASCGGSAGSTTAAPSGSAEPAPRAGGTYKYPLQWDPASLFPPTIYESPAEVAHQLFEGLVAYETRDDGTVVTVPCLAESWSSNGDATVWSFRLRRGVRFQSPVGREVTAADVVAVFRYVTDPKPNSYLAYMYAIVAGTDDEGYARPRDLGVEAVGRYTVRITLKQPFAAFPDTLGSCAFWIWPVDYLRREGRAGFEAGPVGTGPFVLSRRVRGESLDLRRNPSWWNASSGQPYLEGVHFRIFESVPAELLAFQQGLIDYTWVPRGQVAASRSLPQVHSGEWEGRVLPVQAVFSIGFTWTDPVVGGEAGRLVREAVDCAIDRASLVQENADGVYIAQTGLVPRVFPGWEDEQPPQAYDPDRARRLYRQAGSPPLSLTYWDDRTVEAGAYWVRDACAAAGVPLELRRLTWERFASGLVRGEYQVFFTGWIADYPSYDDFLYPVFFSSLSATSIGTGYADPDVDRLLSLARSTVDPVRRLDLSRRAAHEILEDRPLIPLFEPADYRLLNTRVHGFAAGTTLGVDMWRLWIE